MLRNLPVASPKPDVTRFIDILLGKAKSARPPLVEYLIDDVLRRPITSEMLGRQWVDYPADDVANRDQAKLYLDNFVDFFYRMGYDFVRFERGFSFDRPTLATADTATGTAKQRSWADEHHGSIMSWEDFERYPWPKIEDVDFFPFEYINRILPDGMGLISCHASGLFENLSQMMSFEGLCMALYDDPALVRAIVDRLADLMAAFHRQLLGLDRLVVVFQGDDMGFRTGTLISPDDLRKYILPWHKLVAAQAHAAGRPYFLHSCGQLGAIMDDLIDDVKIDAKHSYEDVIIPAPDFQARYGDRIAVLGGLDINILAGGTPEDVRARARELMTICGARGRYAIGSGNSVPSYIPVPNYLAMVDEALGFGG